jgi:putative methyltransferase (TIGR04325 family)
MGRRSLDFATFTSLARSPRRRPARGPFPTWQVAVAASDGYEDPRIVDLVADKTAALAGRVGAGAGATISRQGAQDLLALVLPPHPGSSHDLRVLDVGGACGAKFWELDVAAPGLVQRWDVVDTAAMVARARSSRGAARLQFHEDLHDAAVLAPDVVIASGLLQYTPDPPSTLTALGALGAARLYLTRTAVRVDGAPAYVVMDTPLRDHGPGPAPAGTPDVRVSVPMALHSEMSLRHVLDDAGYEVRLRFDEGDAWHVRGVRVNHVGLLAERR